MPYECQTFKKGQILTHECMNKIDEWLAYICGREIVSGEVNAEGELVFTTCDGTSLNVGKISSSEGGSGKDGVSPTVEITHIDGGQRITITDVNGSQSFDVIDAYTPIKGVDYYTEAEKSEFSEYIASELAKRGQISPEFAQSEEWLKENGDTSKLYVLPDGMIWAHVYTSTTVPAYTNILKTVTVYENKRWSHSSRKYVDGAGHITTEKFPVKKGDIVRVNTTKVPVLKRDYSRAHYFNDDGVYVSGHYDASVALYTAVTEEDGVCSWEVGTIDDDLYSVEGNVSMLAGADDITQMLISMNLTNSVTITADDYKDLILTINEPIEMREIVDWRWANTGRAFVPADYEDRIVELEEMSAEHESKIDILEKAVVSGGLDTNYTQAIERIKNWKYPVYEDASVFLLNENKPAPTATDKTTAGIYAKYDALMAANPEFIKRVEHTEKASDGTTPLYAYHFKEADPHNADPIWSEIKPVILICSGVHPTEHAGVHSMYHALEEITINPKLRDLRRNIHFIVVPMINPSAFSDSEWGVRNPDGIQVHYNFEVDFKYPNDEGYVTHGNRNHGGETPLSIPETRFFDGLMSKYQEELACVLSCHNNDVDTHAGVGYIWCSCATHFMCNVGFRLIDKMSHAWRDKYGEETFDAGVKWANDFALNAAATGSPSVFDPRYVREQPDWDHRVGRASISSSGGTEYKQALKYGIHGINVEACARCMILDKDYNKTFTSNVITLGTETYVNFFRTFMAAYDPKDKKDYAPNLPWSD